MKPGAQIRKAVQQMLDSFFAVCHPRKAAHGEAGALRNAARGGEPDAAGSPAGAVTGVPFSFASGGYPAGM